MGGERNLKAFYFITIPSSSGLCVTVAYFSLPWLKSVCNGKSEGVVAAPVGGERHSMAAGQNPLHHVTLLPLHPENWLGAQMEESCSMKQGQVLRG